MHMSSADKKAAHLCNHPMPSGVAIIDLTAQMCKTLLQRFDPIPKHALELVDLVSSPLLDKLPVYQDLFHKICREVGSTILLFCPHH